MTGMEANRGLIVAIDGPAGAGKSTLARRVALALKLPYINTGLMYRALTKRALSDRINPGDEERLAAEASTIEFWVRPGEPDELAIEGVASPTELTSFDIEENVSAVARHPAVRRILRDRQRSLGAGGCVMEGRDIGTVVFPDADVKVFVSAAPDVRAGRRSQEEGRGEPAARAVGSRDEKDSLTNPLVPAADAFVVDTTHLSPDQVFEEVLGILEARESRNGVPVEPNG